MPKPQVLQSSLWGLNRARLLTAAIVVAVGALLRFTEAFPYPFDTFAMTVLGGAAACLVLPLGERRDTSAVVNGIHSDHAHGRPCA